MTDSQKQAINDLTGKANDALDAIEEIVAQNILGLDTEGKFTLAISRTRHGLTDIFLATFDDDDDDDE